MLKFDRTAIVVSAGRVLEYRGDLVLVKTTGGVSSYNTNYYRIIVEGEENDNH